MARNPPNGLSNAEEAIWLDGYDTGFPDGEAAGALSGKTDAFDDSIVLCRALVKELANAGQEGPARRADRLLKKLQDAKDELTP